VLQAREAGRDVVRFYVSDTGIGVSKEAQAKLFQPYVQAAIDTARRYADLGVHRLAIQPPTMEGSAIDALIETVAETLVGRV